MVMKTELATCAYERGRPSFWVLHNLAHTLLGLANLSKGKGYSVLNCPAVVPTLEQEPTSFLWVIVERYAYQKTCALLRRRYRDDTFIHNVAQDV